MLKKLCEIDIPIKWSFRKEKRKRKNHLINIIMKKALILILIACFYLNGISQETKKTNTLLKELAENGCNCVDSINTYNKTPQEISKEINKCIDDQVGAYQLGSKLMGIDLSEVSSKDKGKTKGIEINIEINSDKDSKDYKDSYYEVERYMMNSCKSLKIKVASSDLENYYSVSKNPEAKKLYSKGVKEMEKENYAKAITYFEKAIEVDSLFAFAWDNVGICNRKLNNYDKAIYAYTKSLELDALGIMPLQNIAVAYKYKKEFDKAISAYERLAELDSKNPEVYYGIGETYSLYLKEYEKGLENMCKAYNLYIQQKSPYRADAEKIIGIIYSEMKKQEKEERFKTILKENNITTNY